MSDETQDDCAHPEHARLQTTVIELLKTQVSELRTSLGTQTEEIIELRRLVRVRDDLLQLQAEELARLRGPRGAGWLARLLRGPGRSST